MTLRPSLCATMAGAPVAGDGVTAPAPRARAAAWPAGDRMLVEGEVPAAIDAPLHVARHWQIGRDQFRLTLPSGLAFHYRRGHGTVFARGPDVADAEVALFFDGSVRGAIAWLGGFVPLHASAVVHDGAVHAFTGASGEGKSTLVAALAQAGFQTFCDDVLVIDPAGDGEAIGLPGHPRLKLWRDALALTGHRAGEPVRPGIDKVFVAGAGTGAGPLPVRRLYVLDSEGDPAPAIMPLQAGERFTAIRDAQYRPRFGTAALAPERYFRATMRLGQQLAVRRFARPRRREAFRDGVERLIADIRDGRCEAARP